MGTSKTQGYVVTVQGGHNRVSVSRITLLKVHFYYSTCETTLYKHKMGQENR